MNDQERISKLRYALTLAEEAITETGRYTIWLQVIRKALEDTSQSDAGAKL